MKFTDHLNLITHKEYSIPNSQENKIDEVNCRQTKLSKNKIVEEQNYR